MPTVARQYRTRSPSANIESVVWHLALLGLWAVGLALAFPRPGWGGLAHVALAPAALLAIRSANPRRLLWTSYSVAMAWWLVKLGWMSRVTVGGYVVMAACLALYLPVALWLVRQLHRRYRYLPMTLLLPMVWVSLELVRTYFPAGGFLWFALGHSQAPYDPSHGASKLIQIADIFGEHGVSFLVAMTNGLIVDALTRPWFQHVHGKRRFNRVLCGAAVIWGAAIGGAWCYGSYRIAGTDALPQGRQLRVAVVQTNVAQDNKNNPTLQQLWADWDRMLALTRHAALQHPAPRLIVWPETMVPVALNGEALAHYEAAATGAQTFHEQIQSLALSLQTHLLVGAPAYTGWTPAPDQPDSQRPGQIYNSAYLYRPDGSQFPQRYDKVHRVPFGEYLPWVESVPALKRLFIRYLSPYEVDYTIYPGQRYTLFETTPPPTSPNTTTNADTASTGAAYFATPICFEDAVARVTRRMVYGSNGHKRADMLINLTNDGWFAGTHQGLQHFQIAVFRCIENRVPMARSVNTGVSGFIDSAGRVGPIVAVDGKTQQVEATAAHTVRFDPRVTMFSRLGHGPAILLALVTAVLSLNTFFRRKNA